MAHKKNKTEILDRIITDSGLSGEFDWDFWDYDYYDYHDYYCDCHLCVPEYKYLPLDQSNLIYRVGKRKNIHFVGEPIIGRMIDMSSVYSKEILRQKRINFFLGLESDFRKPTFADIGLSKIK